MEQDKEVKGGGNSYTSYWRQYDPRLGRWLSDEPKPVAYESGYAAFRNNPITNADPRGDYTKIGMALRKIFGGKVTTDFVRGASVTTTIKGIGLGTKALKGAIWASKSMWKIHQEANSIGIFRNETKTPLKNPNYKQQISYVDALDRATVYADGDQFQTGSSSYRHAMRNKGQSKEEAMKLADAFVRKQYKAALKLKTAGKIKEAYYELGIGLHTLQDATSPSHAGFQEWSGEESVAEQAAHVNKEMVYPGRGSYLQAVTNWLLDMFEKSKELPKGNLFKKIKSD